MASNISTMLANISKPTTGPILNASSTQVNHVNHASTWLDLTTTLTLTTSGQPVKDGSVEALETGKSAIALYYRGTIISMGLLGNVLAFLVLTRPNMRKATTCSFMAVIALCDFITMIISLSWWLGNFKIFPISTAWGCRIRYSLFFLVIHISVALLVGMTVEKLIAVWFPLKAAIYCTLRNARITIGIICTAILGLNLNHLFTRPDVVNPRTNATTCLSRTLVFYSDSFQTYHLKIWPWIDATMYSFIPILSLIVMNTMILIKLRQSYSKHRQISYRKSDDISPENPQRQITVMLLMTTTFFVILTMPVALIVIFEKNWVTTTPYETAVKRLVVEITSALMYTNHAINFWLYCFAASRFRQELLRMFCCQTSQNIHSGYSKESGSQRRRMSTVSSRVSAAEA